MVWIKTLFGKLSRLFGLSALDYQQKLILLVALPCLLITIVSLVLANSSSYLLAFIISLLVLLIGYILVASKLDADYQLRTLTSLLESMIEGDYSLRGRLPDNHVFAELFHLINNLSETLAKHKFEAKESRLLLERILEQIQAMVFATDHQGYVVMANMSARKLLFFDVTSLERTPLATTSFGQEIISSEPGIIRLSGIEVAGEYFLIKENFLSAGQPHQLYFITNAERLLMEQERKAWRSLLRVLSHEMNNSLTPIAAISQSMQIKLNNATSEVNRPSLLEGVNIINERANSLSDFIASYSQLSHLAKPNKTKINLDKILNATALLFPELTVNIESSCQVELIVDKGQFEQVLINLFKNANEAMSQLSTRLLTVKINQQAPWLYIYLIDHGHGIANTDNLFVPFYSTKPQGSGIGLALCRQILFNHDGLISLANRSDNNGVTVKLSLPASKNGVQGESIESIV